MRVAVEPRHIVNAFETLYYESGVWSYSRTQWLGVPVFQTPLDMWVMQEIIYETQPDFIIETGTACGGSALFYTSVFNGRVITIDLQNEIQPWFVHERILFLKGDSVDVDIARQVGEQVAGKRVMVVLDSNHTTEHVARELALYSPLVSPGCYLVVFDTNLGGHPVINLSVPGPGPLPAVLDFLRAHPEFEADAAREKFMMTWARHGWLRRRA